MGNYPNFKEVWDNVRDSVKEGSHVFSLMIAVGTAGDDASDFSGIRTILYNPSAYEVYALENVFDQRGKGSSMFSSSRRTSLVPDVWIRTEIPMWLRLFWRS